MVTEAEVLAVLRPIRPTARARLSGTSTALGAGDVCWNLNLPADSSGNRAVESLYYNCIFI